MYGWADSYCICPCSCLLPKCACCQWHLLLVPPEACLALHQHCKPVPHGSAAAAVPDMEQDSLLQTAIFTWFRLAAACPGVGHSARVPLQEMEREDAAADGRLPDNSNAEPADEEPSGAGRFSFGMNQQVSTNKLGGCGKCLATGADVMPDNRSAGLTDEEPSGADFRHHWHRSQVSSWTVLCCPLHLPCACRALCWCI